MLPKTYIEERWYPSGHSRPKVESPKSPWVILEPPPVDSQLRWISLGFTRVFRSRLPYHYLLTLRSDFTLNLTSKFTKGQSIEQVREVLERMPRIGQESDQPLETILTM
jgi:hypothetical protein